MKKRIMAALALAMIITVLAVGTAQAQGSSLIMTSDPPEVAVGEPVTLTITKTNRLPSDHDWQVRDFLPTGMEFVSATSSQGSCALYSAEELGIPPTDVNGSGVVQCDLGTIPSGYSATMEITVIPTLKGDNELRRQYRGEPGSYNRRGGVGPL